MAKKTEKKIKKELETLAFGKVSDAVSLLFLSDEEVLSKIKLMKLNNISEIKRPKGGGMEIKFFDRIKACEKLIESEASDESGLNFFAALEKGAESLAESGDNG